jgi:F-type H+-transporting ATPase subunit a
MSDANAFTWGSLVSPVTHGLESIHVDAHVGFDVLVTSGFLILVAVIAGRKYRASEMVEADGKLDFSTFWEIVVGGIYSFTKSIIHDAAKPMFFLVGSVALFILSNNLIGSIPGFNPPTDQFNVTIVLALIVFVTINLVGLYKHGLGFIKHFLGPVWWLSPLILPIELISHFVKPLSLALRLFGNITGDHKVGGVFFALVPLIIPLPFLGMGVFVAFIQTFVFTLLTLIYIKSSLDHAH